MYLAFTAFHEGKLKDRYDASRQVSVNSVWRKINRRQMGINDTPRSLINWLEQQFTEIAFISGEQPTEEEKCRSLWQILEYGRFSRNTPACYSNHREVGRRHGHNCAKISKILTDCVNYAASTTQAP
mmetsp:Transcript_13937/g.56112  ORF Transcript_13937/g.56112 Transcript_13937/m.56112 type:complete len:127 (+) Transcript_13937:1875-2255(+)